MDKRCTNSSCRKTFSTLNYGGQCPFCGKIYPQLRSARKDGLPAPVIHPFQPAPEDDSILPIQIIRKGKSGRKNPFRLFVRQVLGFQREGRMLKAAHALLVELSRAGYAVERKARRLLMQAIREDCRLLSTWRLTGDMDVAGRQVIVPLFHSSFPKQRRGSKKPSKLNKPIEDLDLSVRAYNCLKRAGIDTVADLMRLDEQEWEMVRNLGKKSIAEIQNKLLALGFSLRLSKS